MSAVIFSITQLLPGDVTVTILGEDASIEQREALREELGLNDPIAVQYLRWARDALGGELGLSYRTREPVADMLKTRIPVTIELAMLSILVATAIAIPAAVAAAKNHGTLIEPALTTTAMMTTAIPWFWLGLILIYVFSLKLSWLPTSGYVALSESVSANLRHMTLPVITVATGIAGVVMRQTRASLLSTVGEDYLRTAKAKGLSPRRVLYRHALRNALIPVLSIVGLQAGSLLGGTVVTETVFSLPGLGRMIVVGIFERNFTVVQGALLAIVIMVLAINIVTDLLYAWMDPRIRLR